MLKEKMMDAMMGGMSTEEKKEMMDVMMDKFFSSMTDEEKKSMMQEMMPKMMKEMMGGGGMMNMMGMMMGGGSDGDGKTPMDMCQKMMSSISQGNELASFATPELRSLFYEWVEQINEELLKYVHDDKSAGTKDIADHLNLTEESVIYLLGKLAQEKKVNLTPSE